MTILFFKGDETSARSLATLASERSGDPLENILPFDASNPFVTAPTEITLVAHTSDEAQHIGERTPAQLAQDFSKMFGKGDKTKLEHVYLVSCEAGMCKDGKPSLAQKFAEEMQKKGFTKLSVHAIANPQGSPIEGMRVEVVNKGGVTAVPSGTVRALLFTNKASQDLDDEISALDTRIKASDARSAQKMGYDHRAHMAMLNERKAKEESRRVDKGLAPLNFSLTLDYKNEMKQPYNTFTADGPLGFISEPVAHAIKRLQSKKLDIVNLNYSDEDTTKYMDRINILIDKLKKPSTMDVLAIGKVLDDHEKSEKTHSKLPAFMTKKFTQSTYHDLVIEPLRKDIKAFESECKARPISSPTVLSATPINDASSDDELFDAISDTQPLLPKASGDNGKTQCMRDKMANFRPETGANCNIPALLVALTEYKKQRTENEWGYHYNFLKLVSFVYLILDACTGSNHFSSKHRDVKLSATDKLMHNIEHAEQKTYTPKEINALNEGRLGRIVNKDNGGLDTIQESALEARTEKYIEPHQPRH